jgi:hypothetical protein
MFKRKTDLVVRDWKQDLIYLVQFARCPVIPSPSPYCLKLELWLRFTKLNYINVSNNFKFGSSKGKLPFIEVNGRQIPDSYFIINNLKTMFNVDIDKNLTEKELATATAYTALLEESLIRVIMYYRSFDAKWMFSNRGFLPHFTGIKKIVIEKTLPKKLQKWVSYLLDLKMSLLVQICCRRAGIRKTFNDRD